MMVFVGHSLVRFKLVDMCKRIRAKLHLPMGLTHSLTMEENPHKKLASKGLTTVGSGPL